MRSVRHFAQIWPLCLYCQTPTDHSDQLCCSGCRFLFRTSGEGFKVAAPIDSPYDNENVRLLYDFGTAETGPRYRFAVSGLQCSSCVHILEDLPKFLTQVVRARLVFSRSELYIETTADHSLGMIIQFLNELGYPSRLLRVDEDREDDFIAEDRALLARIAVAGACSGNIMLFSLAIYGGLEGPLAFVFNGLSLLLFLPILFYSAFPIYRGAWTSLRLGYLTVDGPLTAALILGFAASTFNWWRGSGNIYFDSTAGFIFFILLSRWFLKISQRKWGQGFFSEQMFGGGFFAISRQGVDLKLPGSEIKAGDRITLHRHDRLPVDALLLSDSVSFDTSWMTGEPVPRVLQSSMEVSAGYKLLSETAQLESLGTTKNSQLMSSLRRTESQALSNSERIGKFDQAAQWLLLSVFILSLAMVILGPWILSLSFDEAFSRALGLLVVACPCALAFGGPLAYGLALRQGAKEGIVIKSADVLDRVLECKNLVFDKTGTLTMGALQLVHQFPSIISETNKNIILALEKHSHHPVAYAFRDLWGAPSATHLALENIHEVSGKKIGATLYGQLISISANSEGSGALSVILQIDYQTVATFEFEDPLRKDVQPLLKRLAQKFPLAILSGDRQDRVTALADHLQLPFTVALGACTPSAKAEWIQKSSPSLMLGDGVNDAEALTSAHVGIVMQGPLAQGLRFGSVYFMKPGLESLPELLSLAQKTKTLVQRNLAFALLYNTVAGAAALCGWINPLVAAALMPLSSLLILASTWEASR